MEQQKQTTGANDVSGTDEAFRVAIRTSAAAIIKTAGYSSVEPSVLGVLTEMMQSYICQIGRSAKYYSELANRCNVMVTDVSLALIDAGQSLEGLSTFAQEKVNRISYIRAPVRATEPSKPKSLQVANAPSVPNYVHDNLPPFPDKHTYITTPAKRLPPTDYQLVREKAASQKRDVETALTKFIAKAVITESSQFCEDKDNEMNAMFPLISCKPSALSYLNALLPKDNEQYEEFDLKQEQNLPQSEEKPSKAKRLRFTDSQDSAVTNSSKASDEKSEASKPD